MIQNKRSCACLYIEDEYEKLAIEAHVECRKEDRNGNERYRGFFCKYCRKDDFKDKNCLSWHRIKDECPKWKGPGSLKMYPMFGNNRTELGRILQKHNLSPRRQGRKRASAKTRDRSRKRGKLTSHREQQKEGTRIEVKVIAKGLDIQKQQLQGKLMDEWKGKGWQDNLPVNKRKSLRVKARKDKNFQGSKIDNHLTWPLLPRVEMPLPGQNARLNSAPSIQKKRGRITRATVEAEARAHAATFTAANFVDLGPPPTECPPSALFYLIHEAKKPPLDPALLEHPELCIEALQEADRQGHLAIFCRRPLETGIFTDLGWV